MTEKKLRTPRNAESILQGALKLSFEEKIKVFNALKSEIKIELAKKEEEAKAAKELTNGL